MMMEDEREGRMRLLRCLYSFSLAISINQSSISSATT